MNTFVEDDISLLQHCRNLRELSWVPHFRQSTTSQSQLAELIKIDLSHLRHLSLGVTAAPAQETALRALSAPQVRSLRFDHGTVIPSPNQFSNLESLYVAQVGHHTSVVTMLRALPSIRGLTFDFKLDSTPDYLLALLERDEHGQFEVLPLLCDLTVKIDRTASEWVDAIIRLRNNARSESSTTPFLLHLPRGMKGVLERNVGLEDVRSRHPEYIDDRVVFKDPFDTFSQAGWSVLDC